MSEASAESWREAFASLRELLELAPARRREKLAQMAAAQPELYAQVDTLLRADARAEARGFIEGGDAAAPEFDFATEMPPAAASFAPGMHFGPWQLERELGRGGMGEVWLASRVDHLYQRQVALKTLHESSLRPGVHERFAREGQILAKLAHPNIARLLDAGVSADGRLFLVLEYVDGERIDRWCDTQRLDVEARLKLFLDVCTAVAHAHSHLVVHRDLKPSNILVTASGEVKLLDFGIAKLLASEAGDAGAETEITRHAGRVLTPEYAAPEQMRGETITTLTDVYSLGVLLYGLLCGRRPYGSPTQSAAQLEREVLETEPRPPSAMAPMQARDPAAAAAQAEVRSTTPYKLARSLRGDLDNIVGRALKKLPAERYPSVPALADDLRRHLAHRPVLAQPDSFGYRARKYLRRHRVGATAGVAMALLLVAGIAGTLWEARQAQAQARAALEQAQRVKRTKDFFVSVFENADPLRRADGAPVTLAQALDEALKRVDTELAADPGLQGDLLDDLGEIRAGQGDMAGAKALFQRALPLHEQTLAPDAPALANTLVNLGLIEAYLGNTLTGRPDLERAVAILERHADTEGDALSNARSGLAQVYNEAGDNAAAAALVRQSLDYYRQAPGLQETRLAISLGNMGITLLHLERYAEAKPYLDECLAVVERNLGRDSPNLIGCLEGLERIAAHDGDLAAQAAVDERSLAIERASFPGDHHWLAKGLLNLGQVRLRQQRRADGENLLRESIAMYQRLGGDLDHKAQAQLSLAQSRERAGDPAEAFGLAEQGLSSCAGLSCQTAGELVQKLQVARTQAEAELAQRH